jgi:dTDP-4-amino-4,6-dideoxygalactose transaminase
MDNPLPIKIEPAVPLFRPNFRIDECLEAVKDCLEKGWTSIGYKTLDFEEKWRQYAEIRHAHYVNSATSGLHLALEVLKRRLNWQQGDEVITTPLTFVATAHVIHHAGLNPVFADVDDSLCLDPQSVLDRISCRTKAIIFVGLGGRVGQYESILRICHEKGISFILDAAHMAGTKIYNRQVGHDADATVFSFHSVKNLPTADGGMLCLKEKVDDELARKLSWMGIDKDTYTRTDSSRSYLWDYGVSELGFKYHGNSVLAALGLVALKYLDDDNQARANIARHYLTRLADIPSIKIPTDHLDSRSSFHLMQILSPARDALIQHLAEHNIGCGVHYRSLTTHEFYKQYKGTCPSAESYSEQLLSLPMHPTLSTATLDAICDVIKTTSYALSP